MKNRYTPSQWSKLCTNPMLSDLHYYMFYRSSIDRKTDYSFRHVVSLTENVTAFRVSLLGYIFLSGACWCWGGGQS